MAGLAMAATDSATGTVAACPVALGAATKRKRWCSWVRTRDATGVQTPAHSRALGGTSFQHQHGVARRGPTVEGQGMLRQVGAVN